MWIYVNDFLPSKDGNYFCAKYEYNQEQDGLIYTYGVLHYNSESKNFTEINGETIFDNVRFWMTQLKSPEKFIPLMT